ncbi:MAG: usg protein [Hyphomicrobiaceae bacterium]
MADRDALAQLQGFSLTTAEILYRLPDHPSLLQTYVWQEYDLHPRFPRLMAFLGFWAANIEGQLFRITVAHKALISPRELRIAAADLRLH